MSPTKCVTHRAILENRNTSAESPKTFPAHQRFTIEQALTDPALREFLLKKLSAGDRGLSGLDAETAQDVLNRREYYENGQLTLPVRGWTGYAPVSCHNLLDFIAQHLHKNAEALRNFIGPMWTEIDKDEALALADVLVLAEAICSIGGIVTDLDGKARPTPIQKFRDQVAADVVRFDQGGLYKEVDGHLLDVTRPKP